MMQYGLSWPAGIPAQLVYRAGPVAGWLRCGRRGGGCKLAAVNLFRGVVRFALGGRSWPIGPSVRRERSGEQIRIPEPGHHRGEPVRS